MSVDITSNLFSVQQIQNDMKKFDLVTIQRHWGFAWEIINLKMLHFGTKALTAYKIWLEAKFLYRNMKRKNFVGLKVNNIVDIKWKPRKEKKETYKVKCNSSEMETVYKIWIEAKFLCREYERKKSLKVLKELKGKFFDVKWKPPIFFQREKKETYNIKYNSSEMETVSLRTEMCLETAAFFRFNYVAASNNNELYEKFEFFIKDVNPITYGSKPIILIPLNTV